MNDSLNIPIREIMSAKLMTLHPKDTLQRAKEIFFNYDIHHIPIEVMSEIRGILSLGDILFLEGMMTKSYDEFLKQNQFESSAVEDFMTSKPYCVEQDSFLSEALGVMIEKRVNCLPVNANGRLVGLVTNYDMMKYLKTTIEKDHED